MDTPSTATTRQTIATWLIERLPETVTVIDYPTMPDDPADHITGMVIILRDTIEPAPLPGHYEETHQLWVLDPHVDRETSELMLDRTTDAVLAVIDSADSLLHFESAARDTWADKYPAYRVAVTVTSTTN